MKKTTPNCKTEKVTIMIRAVLRVSDGWLLELTKLAMNYMNPRELLVLLHT